MRHTVCRLSNILFKGALTQPWGKFFSCESCRVRSRLLQCEEKLGIMMENAQPLACQQMRIFATSDRTEGWHKTKAALGHKISPMLFCPIGLAP
jgi:hypothetical protein